MTIKWVRWSISRMRPRELPATANVPLRTMKHQSVLESTISQQLSQPDLDAADILSAGCPGNPCMLRHAQCKHQAGGNALNGLR